MFIQPNGTIKLLRGVPLDPSYGNTWLPTSASVQSDATNGLAKYTKFTFSDQTYQRVNKNTLRIQMVADRIYDCNYLMFQNYNFGSEKWFYAFIKKVEYVNNNVSEVEYEIDDMQTWMFDWDFEECYIDRMTEPYDRFGDNIVPEELDIGTDYFKQPYPGTSGADIINFNNLAVCVLITRNVTGQSPVASQTINNIYTPLRIIKGLDPTYPTAIDVVLNQYQEDEILVVYEYPAVLDDNYPNPYTLDKPIIRPTSIGAYTPRNKKLYSYPFCKLIVSNNSGQVADFKWENFDNPDTATFRVKGVFVTTPEIMLYPLNYNSYAEAFDEGIVLSNFPQCPWSGDTFKAWWAQNKASFVTSAVTSAISAIAAPAAVGAVSGGAAGAAAGAAVGLLSASGQVANSMAKVRDIKNTPSQTHGQTQTESLNAGIGRIQFNFYCVHIRPDIAMRIDGYFDRYGYAQHTMGTPVRDYRPHWSYVKTIGCEIKPKEVQSILVNTGLPADAMEHINKIHDNGITYWKTLSEIGNYSLDNSPPAPSTQTQGS